jgi:hypothetical protein
MDSEPELDHLKFVKNNPEIAAEHLDHYKMLVDTFYNTYRVLTQELDTVLEDFTDPRKAIELRKKLDEEVRHSKPDFRGKSPMEMEVDAPQPKNTIYYPFSAQNSNYTGARYEAEQEAWGASDPDVPVENSEGWEVEPYAGTNDGPIPCDSDEEGETSHAKVKPYGPPGCRTNPMNLEEYTGGNYINPHDWVKTEASSEMWTYPYIRDTYEVEQYNTARDYTSFSSYYPGTSNPEYIPSRRPYVPDGVRRTPRHHGWTSGMYREEDDE